MLAILAHGGTGVEVARDWFAAKGGKSLEEKIMATRMGFEPTIFGVTGRYVKTATPPGHTGRRTIAVQQFECMSFIFECQDESRRLPDPFLMNATPTAV